MARLLSKILFIALFGIIFVSYQNLTWSEVSDGAIFSVYQGQDLSVLSSLPTDIKVVKFHRGEFHLKNPITLPDGVGVHLKSGVRIYVDADATFTISGPFKVDFVDRIEQKFFSDGKVLFLNPETAVFLESFGADPQGITDSDAAFSKALASLPNGGTILGSGAAARYTITRSVVIRTNNITIDLAGATIIGLKPSYFMCDGEVKDQTQGKWKAARRNCFVKNAVFGNPANPEESRLMGGFLRWCVNCGFENIQKWGRRTAGFQMSICQDCHFRNIYNNDGDLNRIAFLMHMTWRSEITNCHAANGSFIYGFQVKGGKYNTVRNSSVKNVRRLDPELDLKTNEMISRNQIGFRDRGDAPWNESSTSTEFREDGSPPTYPFKDLNWNVRDNRRASAHTIFENCQVENFPGLAFQAQEAIATKFLNISAKKVDAGVALNRLPGGAEDNVLLSGFTLEEVQKFGLTVSAEALSPYKNVVVENGCISVAEESAAKTYKINSEGVRISDLRVGHLKDGFACKP